jgi:hypothetical protein
MNRNSSPQYHQDEASRIMSVRPGTGKKEFLFAFADMTG